MLRRQNEGAAGPRISVLMLSLGLAAFGSCISRLMGFELGSAWPIISILLLVLFPGLLLLEILGFKLRHPVGFLLVVALSLTIIMALGLTANEVLHALGQEAPLGEGNVVVVLGCLIIVSYSGYLWKKRESRIPKNVPFEIDLKVIGAAICMVVSGIEGAIYTNITGTTWFSLAFLVSVPFFLFAFLLREDNKRGTLPIVLASAGLSLLLNRSLISDYLTGFDVNVEYFVLSETLDSSYWNFELQSTSNGSLAVTILPVLLDHFCDINPILFLKIAPPLLFSTVPVAFYLLYSTKLNALLVYSSLLLVLFRPDFQIMPSLAKQEIAMFFMAVILLTLLWYRASGTRNRSVILILVLGMVLSHYSTSFLFVIVIVSAFVVFHFWRIPQGARPFSFRFAAIVALLTYLWYSFVSAGSVISAAVNSLANVLNGMLEGFSSPEYYDPYVREGTHFGGTLNIVQVVSMISLLFTFVFVFLGFLRLVFREHRNPGNSVLIALPVASFVVLLGFTVIPNASFTLNLTRIMLFTMLFFSPLFFMGMEVTVDVRKFRSQKIRKSVIMSALVILLSILFATNSGIAYHLAGYPSNISLDTDMDYPRFSESQVESAGWVAEYAGLTPSLTSPTSRILLLGYLDKSLVQVLSNDTTTHLQSGQVYLRTQDLTQLDLPIEMNGVDLRIGNQNPSRVLDTGDASFYIYGPN